MVDKKNRYSSRFWLAIGTAFLTACSSGADVENLLGADPQLERENQVALNQTDSDTETTDRQPQNSSIAAETNPAEETENVNSTDTDSDPSLDEQEPAATTEDDVAVTLPTDFPSAIPLYPQAELLAVRSTSTSEGGKTIWRSPDPAEEIETYYERELSDRGWEIIEPFAAEAGDTNRAIASNENLLATISVTESIEDTKLTVEYEPQAEALAPPTELDNFSESESELPSEAIADSISVQQAPEQLRPYIQDLAALSIFTGDKNNGDFAPNETITRRDFARWLVATNNKLHPNPRAKINLAAQTDKPAFQDVKSNDPDFAAIQGLANSGIIPSVLTDDSSQVLFQPDAPLTREDLITWKVPLDIRKALPTATISEIEETWGFQDAKTISPKALRALFADFQNEDRANVSRVFGYTTLFQPKKPVTRAEAAAALWYFGFQGDGISAEEVLQAESPS